MQIAGGPPVLEARAAGVVLGAATFLDAVDFCLRRGEFVALLGPNGSGKTTLVRALLGIVPVSRGTVELFGTPIERFSAWERIGYVPQRATAATGVPATVFEVVLSGRVARSRRPGGFRARDREAAGQAMEAVGLAHLARRPVAMLSGGQQQRVLIARALATEPEVLVLDEAVSSVDVASQRSFSETLRSLEHAGLSVLAVAHALGVLEPLVTRAVVLEGGRVVYEGAPRPADVALDHPHPHHPETPSARRERASFDRTVERR